MQHYDDKGRPTVFHLKAKVHGTIQGNASFERKLAGVMEGLGFARCPEHASLHSRDVGTMKEIHVLVHVDDFICGSADTTGEVTKVFETAMDAEFGDAKRGASMGWKPVDYFLGINIERKLDGVTMAHRTCRRMGNT